MENQPASSPENQPGHPGGTPYYGDFGHPADPAAPPTDTDANNSFNEHGRLDAHETRQAELDNLTPIPLDPAQQVGHVDQNQDTAAVAAAQGSDEEQMRAAYTRDDPRYAGGDHYDPATEQTTL